MTRVLRVTVGVLRELVVGDDPLVALGVVALLGACAALAHTGSAGWWLPVVGVPGLLGTTLARGLRERRWGGPR